MRRRLIALARSARARRRGARCHRRDRLGRARARRGHEAQPRRLLDPARGLREAHPDVPEDGGRQRRRLHAVLRLVRRADARRQGGPRGGHRRALARPRRRRARRREPRRREVEGSSPTRAWSRTRSSSSSCATATRRRSRAGTTSSAPTSRSSRRTRSPRAALAGTSWPRTARGGRPGKTDKQAQANLLKLFRNVVVQDTSARASLSTFNSGKGDVLLAYENEALFARTQGLDLQFVIPKATILIENPIAVDEVEPGQGGGERVPALPPDARPHSRSSPTTATGRS